MKSPEPYAYALAIVACLAVGAAVGYAIGFDHGWEKGVRSISSAAESEPREPETPSPGIIGDCRPAGCSGQLCVDADEAGNIVTTCEFLEEYACYNTARCERQPGGACGWTMTGELEACLEGARG